MQFQTNLFHGLFAVQCKNLNLFKAVYRLFGLGAMSLHFLFFCSLNSTFATAITTLKYSTSIQDERVRDDVHHQTGTFFLSFGKGKIDLCHLINELPPSLQVFPSAEKEKCHLVPMLECKTIPKVLVGEDIVENF